MISISEWPFCGQKRYCCSAKQHPHTTQPQMVLQSGAKPLNSVSLLGTFLLCTCILQVIKYWKQWGSRDRTRIHVRIQLDSPVPRSRNIVPQCGFFLNLPHCALIGIEKKAAALFIRVTTRKFPTSFSRVTIHGSHLALFPGLPRFGLWFAFHFRVLYWTHWKTKMAETWE